MSACGERLARARRYPPRRTACAKSARCPARPSPSDRCEPSRPTITCAPRFGLAELPQRLHGQRNQAQRFARRIEAPAGESQQAVVGQVRSGNRGTRRWCRDCFPKARMRPRRWRPRCPPAWPAAPDTFRCCGARRLRPSSTWTCTSGRRYRPWLSCGNFSRMMVVAMMGLISTAVMSWLPEAKRARHIPAAARPDDQRLRAGPHHIRQAGPWYSRSRRFARREMRRNRNWRCRWRRRRR